MPKDVKIALHNGVAGTTTVNVGDKVQWTATVLSYVNPPDIFSGNECKVQVSVPADGTPAPSKACHVTGQAGRHSYSCGVGAADKYPDRVLSGNDVIIIDPGEPQH